MEWVNHASFILQSGSTRLICDPWIEGTAFNNGWSLLSPTRLSYEDFDAITHIWFSHEHPDHFSPLNLRKIPEEYRARITVLFHYTKDKRVVKVCKSLGFKIEELPDCQLYEVSQDLKVLCGAHSLLDSWIAISGDGKTILNMNDCASSRPRELEEIRQKTGPIDVLMSQFSYANWVGNPEDHASHRRNAERKLAEMAMQIRAFKPAWFIPFASFVFFSHAENFFMNQGVNRIADVYEFTSRALAVPTVVLYPGDTWEVGAAHDAAAGIQKYSADFERAMRAEPFTSPKVALESLREAATTFLAKCERSNNHLLLRALPRTVIRLSDLNLDVELSFRRGLAETDSRPDIIISSDSLLYCLTTEWGGETLEINGRLQIPPGGKPRHFHWIFRVPRHNGYGSSFSFRFLGGQMFQKARTMLAG